MKSGPMKSGHMLLCVAVLVIAVGLIAGGAGPYAFLAVAGCMAMMGARCG